MPLPLRREAGAVDGSQWHSFPVPRKKPGPPALPPGAPAEGCSACPALSVLRLHLADLRGVLPTRLGSRTNVAHAAPPTRLPPPIRPGTYARSQSLLCSFPWPSHPAGRARTAEAPVPLPSMCFSVPLSDARSVPAGPPCMLPSHRATVQRAFSFSFSTPLPNTQKRVIKWVCLFFFFLYRNKKLAFLPFCFPSLGLNLANGK